MKPRTVPARMSAKRRAQFEAEGRIPFSTIQRKEKPWSTSAKNAGNDGAAITKTVKIPTMKYARLAGARDSGKLATKRIPPRKKRTGTPIRSKPWPNALDPKSHIINGRTVLYGKDLEALRWAVFERAGAVCEAKRHAPNCPRIVGWYDGELDHITARGLGGGFRDDTKENTRWLSSPCHKSKHGQY